MRKLGLSVRYTQPMYFQCIVVELLLVFSSLLVHANEVIINECQSDIYFANGIMTDEGNATKNRDLIRDTLLIEQYNGDISKINKELNFKTAYNQTYGFSGDIYEAYLQLANENDGWGSLYLFVSYVLGNTGAEQDWYNQALALITGMNEVMIQQAYEADLSVQIEDYKNSIALGHSAIVIAHSQGNLFTNDAYKNIIIGDGSWRKDYFTAVAVASPATKLLEDDNKDPHIGFDNDPVAFLGTLGTTDNPNRSYKYYNALGELVQNSFDTQFHSFDYYMGEIILFKDGVGERNVSTDIGKVIIMNFLKDAIENHRIAPSQWKTNEEFELNTCDYKITVKHRYDPSIEMDDIDTMVYPFAPNKKLYQVNGEWVKASCGGENILGVDHEIPTWDGKKDNECFMIDNPQEEKISGENFVKIYIGYTERRSYNYYYSDYASYATYMMSSDNNVTLTLESYYDLFMNEQAQCQLRSQSVLSIERYSGNIFGLSGYINMLEEIIHELIKGQREPYGYGTEQILPFINCELGRVNKSYEDITRLEEVNRTSYDFSNNDGNLYGAYIILSAEFVEYKLYYD